MLLEVKEAERSLLGYFEHLSKQKNINQRCIKLLLNEDEQYDLLQNPHFLNSIKRILQPNDIQCYFCKDGNSYIISPSITYNIFNMLNDIFCNLLRYDSMEQQSFLYDLKKDISSLIVQLESKIQKIDASIAQETQQHEDHQKQTFKEQIKNLKIDTVTANLLKSRRTGRSKPEILIVEDDQFSSRLVKSSLSGNFIVNTASNGLSAVDFYFRYAPDIVFMDIDLPDISGQDIVKMLCSQDQDSFIVMLSGNMDKKNVMQSIELGAKGFVGKPFNREKLIAYIEKFQLSKQ